MNNAMMNIVDILPTVLFSAEEPMRQLAFLKIRNRMTEETQIDIRLCIESMGWQDVSQMSLGPDDQSVNILIPDLTAPAELTVEILKTATSHLIDCWRGIWRPQRKWQIYIIKASHYDLGYDGRIDHMQAEAATYIDLAKRLCEDKDQLHEWHYHIEHMGFIRAYEREKGETALRKLVDDYLSRGMMTLLGNPSGPHWHWMDYEQIARASYPARREMADRFGLEIDSIAVVDNPNSSWAACQAFAKAGFRYLYRFEQSNYRSPGSYQKIGLPRIFYLQGPNGYDQIMISMANGYHEGLWLGQDGGFGKENINLAGRLLSDYLKDIESGNKYGPYPYDVLIMPNYYDWEIPHEDERILAAWRKKWKYPEIHIDNASQGLMRIEDNFKDLIPVLRGDTNNNSADYSSIDPLSQGIKRRCSRLLPFIEGLHAVASSIDSQIEYPWNTFDKLYIDLVEYDEHCWPTMLSGNDMNIFNTSIAKKHKIDRLNDKLQKLCHQPIKSIISKMENISDSNSNPSISVWNSLIHSRTDLVCVSKHLIASYIDMIESVDGLTMCDEQTQAIQPLQQLSSGDFVFIGNDLPAFGYRHFSIGQKTLDACGASAISVKDSNDLILMQNRFFRFAVGKETGQVLCFDDLKSGRSLLDSESPHKLNQWLRVSTGAFTYTQASKDLKIENIGQSRGWLGATGPVMAQIIVETSDETLGVEIMTTYTLYAELDRLDIENRVLRMDFLHTKVDDRYKENVFVAFPFQIDQPVFRVEHSAGTIDMAHDLLPSNRDFIMLNRWIDVSNDQYGITFVSHEAAAMHLGKIMYNQFSADHRPDKAHLYSYVWSNRMCGLTTLSEEDYHAVLSYSIRPHTGDWIDGQAASFGWNTSSPPLVDVTSIQPNAASDVSFLTIDCNHVQMTVLKRSDKVGHGYIIRLVETDGKSRNVAHINIAFLTAARAWLCDIVENDREELPVLDGVIALPIKAYDVMTIRFISENQDFAQISQAEVTDTTDSSISLQWNLDSLVSQHQGANIYRSEDPGYHPSMTTLISYTEDTRYIDNSLKPGKLYHYYLAPADRNNNQGMLFGPISSRTTLVNQTPPAAITEMGVIPMDVDRLCVYWVKSAEPDVALYRVYRGDQPDFEQEDGVQVGEIEPDPYWYQTYMDEGLSAGTTKYYQVYPIDYTGNIQKSSPCVSGRTPARRRLPEKKEKGL